MTLNNKIRVGNIFESVSATTLDDGYYFVHESHFCGISAQRIIINVQQPYVIFHGSEDYELSDDIFGSFTKLNVINLDI